VRDDISDDDDEGFSRAHTTEQQALWREVEKFKGLHDGGSSNEKSHHTHPTNMHLERNDSKVTTNGGANWLPPLPGERRATTNESKID
jgi:hypothetical protein